MSAADLRAKIRELIASGVLPEDPPPTERPAPTSTPGDTWPRIVVGAPIHAPCTICGEPGPQIQYLYIAGQVVSVHAACDALWQLERAS
jgi:hypothetical protein